MARVLIVCCGCLGRALAGALVADGHAVRGTSRDPERLPAIEAAGAEALLADPDRLGTIVAGLGDVTVLCWLMGSADGGEALHAERFGSLLEHLVDTPVRGLVCEVAGSAGPQQLGRSERLAREATTIWTIPTELVDIEPSDHERWLAQARAAVGRLLAPPR